MVKILGEENVMESIKMKGFSRLTRIDDALQKFFSVVNVSKLYYDEVPLSESLGRVLYEDEFAISDIPGFNRAAVDGYAVRAKDAYGASETSPLTFDVTGHSEIGVRPVASVTRQQAIRIATGAPLPEGADAVIMVEYTEKISDGKIEVYQSIPPLGNVSLKGEDVKKREKVLTSGIILRPQEIGMLAAMGNKIIKVVKKPRIAIFSTGNELIEPGEKGEIGQIPDSNRSTIIAMTRNFGGHVLDLGIAKDTIRSVKAKLMKGLEANMIVVSGSTSIGEKDLLPETVNSLGEPGVIVHGISMRPGKPTALAALETTPIILLPGSPIAAMIAFEVFGRAVLGKMLGMSSQQMKRPTVWARVSRRIPSSLGNKTFVRVLLEEVRGEYVAEPIRISGSGIISSMIKANGLVIIPENKEGYEEKERVKVILLKNIERRFNETKNFS